MAWCVVLRVGGVGQGRNLQAIHPTIPSRTSRVAAVYPYSVACLSNIQPIRAVLRERGGKTPDFHLQGIYSLFPYLPWGRSSKVFVEAREILSKSAGSSTRTGKLDVDLQRILDTPPLRNAFERYCEKALCIEVSTPHFLSSFVPGRLRLASSMCFLDRFRSHLFPVRLLANPFSHACGGATSKRTEAAYCRAWPHRSAWACITWARTHISTSPHFW